MPLDASRNSLVLPLLGLLLEQPAHAYDLTVRLTERYPHLTVTRSSVTTLLKSLTRDGLTVAGEPSRVGNRPPRTGYELSECGVADIRRRVEAGLRDSAVASVDFTSAVAYAGILRAEEAAAVLATRVERIEAERAGLMVEVDGVAEAHMLEVAYWRGIVDAEATWLRGLIARIRSREIEWPSRDGEGV